MEANHADQMFQNNMLQYPYYANHNLVAVSPADHGPIDDGHDATGPMILIGYLNEQPVYRTTHTVAHRMHDFRKLECVKTKYFFLQIWKN